MRTLTVPENTIRTTVPFDPNIRGSLTVTSRSLHDSNACRRGYRKLRQALGGSFGMNEPIPMTSILRINGPTDVAWVLGAHEDSRGLLILQLACCHVADFILCQAEERPSWDRERLVRALAIALDFAYGKNTLNDLLEALDGDLKTPPEDFFSNAAEDAVGWLCSYERHNSKDTGPITENEAAFERWWEIEGVLQVVCEQTEHDWAAIETSILNYYLTPLAGA